MWGGTFYTTIFLLIRNIGELLRSGCECPHGSSGKSWAPESLTIFLTLLIFERVFPVTDLIDVIFTIALLGWVFGASFSTTAEIF